MRPLTLVQRLVMTAILVGAIVERVTTMSPPLLSDGESQVPVKEAVPIGPPAQGKPAPAPPSTAKPAPPLTVSSGAIFRDEFTKLPLDMAWKIELEDKSRWDAEGGELVIVTQPRLASSAKGEEPAVRNRFVLGRDLTGDYTVTARLSVAIVRPGNTVALRIRTEAGDHVTLGYRGFEYYLGDFRRPFLGKRVSGQATELLSEQQYWDQGKPTQVDLRGFSRKPESLWLRIRKERSSFVGSFSFDGTRFDTIGQQDMLRSDGARLELVAYDEGAGVETGARFDIIEIVR